MLRWDFGQQYPDGRAGCAEAVADCVVHRGQACEEAEAHRDRLLNKEADLLRERLTRRDPADHDRIARLKAHVFEGVAAVARTRAEWAREGQRLLDGD
ncbi:hypothetical protein [Amycolatopsis sp. NPDC004169]|uniref:hypothetical protein n=1 Tax=Amycolatopsis sp. NPDC004169 TaxID=3154453 RepID=UPI0033B64790